LYKPAKILISSGFAATLGSLVLGAVAAGFSVAAPPEHPATKDKATIQDTPVDHF
jgi:hypothetical protein